jgi:rfaE bifunctional protein nucleotidyltransferase chain/domain
MPAPPVRSDDPCGAGDRFAATAAGALADGLEVDLAVAAAVTEASAYVARGGASGLSGPTPPETVSRLEQVRARGGTVVATGGCFDLLHAGHVATLEAARRMGDCLVVCLNSDRSVRLLKGPGRPVVTQDDRARVLLALSCVDDVVVFDEDTPEQLLRRLQPDVWVKGGDYDGSELPEARVLPEWGGQVVTVPFLEGRSTTGIVRSIGIPPRAEDGDLRQSG